MFHWRRSVPGASLFLLRVNVQLRASARDYRCCRLYRSASQAAVFSRPDPFGSPSDLVRMAVNATRGYSDSTNRANSPGELEPFLSARSSAPVVTQTRRSATTPEKTRDERAANVHTQDHVSAASSAEGQGSDGKPSKTQQLRKVFKEYGAVGVSFHIGISLISLGIFYLAVSSGLDMASVLCRLGFSESLVQSKLAAGTSTFVLAYAVHKLFAPLRISITLVSVPLIVRHLRKTGLFKPRTSSP